MRLEWPIRWVARALEMTPRKHQSDLVCTSRKLARCISKYRCAIDLQSDLGKLHSILQPRCTSVSVRSANDQICDFSGAIASFVSAIASVAHLYDSMQ